MRANWGAFALLLVVGLALAASFAWLGSDRWPIEITSAFVTLVMAGTAFCIYIGVCAGTEHIALGADAESWTAELFARTFRAARVINDVRFDAGNVDHVVVGSHGVAVVETKWRGHSLYGGPSSPSDRDVGQALWAARKIRLLVGTGGVALDPLPVLILWGPGVSHAAPRMKDGVLVLSAPTERAALSAALGEQIGLGGADSAVTEPIIAYVNSVNGYARTPRGVRPHRMQRA